MTRERLHQLIDRYLTEDITDPEREELVGAVAEEEWADETRAIIHRFLETREFNYGPNLEPLYARIEQAVKAERKPARVIHWMRWAAAAVFILTVSGVLYLLSHDRKPAELVTLTPQEIKAPQINKATITLPSGQQIMLDTVKTGTLIAGIARKTAEGQLVFEGHASSIAYIVTTNPRNSKAMQVTLPDQTQVWLNADTKLEYPTSYGEKDRTVSLVGEADFKVKHNASKPFKVTAGDHVIQDVGTEFNVKAYANEGGTHTTLLEGAVKINNRISLQPGQQFANNKITTANLDEVMAWKNGSFYLDGRELGSVAGDLSRWYDVEVVFASESAKKNTVFGGEMGRDLNLNQAIRVLEKLNVRVKLEGKKLMVE